MLSESITIMHPASQPVNVISLYLPSPCSTLYLIILYTYCIGERREKRVENRENCNYIEAKLSFYVRSILVILVEHLALLCCSCFAFVSCSPSLPITNALNVRCSPFHAKCSTMLMGSHCTPFLCSHTHKRQKRVKRNLHAGSHSRDSSLAASRRLRSIE